MAPRLAPHLVTHVQIIDLSGISTKTKAPSTATTPPKSQCPKELLRWTYTGCDSDKHGREYVLTDDFIGDIVAHSDHIAETGSFGQCRVEAADDVKGLLHVLILDPMHLGYETCATVPAEGVYLCGNGNMQMILPQD